MTIPFLNPGDKVAVISTARKIDPSELVPAVLVLNNWGLEVIFGDNLFEADNQFAGSDAHRLSDLQWALGHPELKAVFFARGGYGTTRLLDQADFAPLLAHPKGLVGFSDITAVHCHANRLGIETVHAAMPFQFGKEGVGESLESLRQVLFGELESYTAPPHEFNRLGTARGKVTGGNLSILAHLMGTASEPDTEGAILFLEDLDEYLYHIDRMMVQLKRAGKLRNLAGLIVGHMTNMRDNTVPFGHTAYQIIQHHTQEYGYPVCFGFPVGHDQPNKAIICGRNATLEVNRAGIKLEYSE